MVQVERGGGKSSFVSPVVMHDEWSFRSEASKRLYADWACVHKSSVVAKGLRAPRAAVETYVAPDSLCTRVCLSPKRRQVFLRKS